MLQTPRLIAISAGIIITAASLFFQVSDNEFTRLLHSKLEAVAYDLRFQYSLPQDVESYPGIIIVDIDEKSLAAEGHWPWPREKLARLVERLFEAGISVLAFDMVFAEPEPNPASLLLSSNQLARDQLSREKPPPLSPRLTQELTNLSQHISGDAIFARSLNGREIALGYVLTDEDANAGSPGQAMNIAGIDAAGLGTVPQKQGITGNIPQLTASAPYGGFFNASPDADGIMRSAPLLYRYQGRLYPSLALETARLFYVLEEIKLKTAAINNQQTIEHVSLDFYDIPTDGSGRVLIPYRGKQGNFSYVSATDVLNREDLSGLIPEAAVAFLGTTAQGLFDWRATPVSPVYPGVEIHASILAGIMEQSFPYRPAWADGADFTYILVSGIILACLLPFVSPTLLLLISLFFIGGTLAGNLWLWKSYGYVMSVMVPTLNMLLLAIFNVAYGFLIELRRKNELKEMFGQYVPPALVEEMSRTHDVAGFDGESRNMTVLFADIRNFTTISENLSATELKDMLNRFFTPMTEIIFQNRGTIDKYVGDMIMAFWGAPLDDPQHARHAIEAALQMQACTTQLRNEFLALGLPEIGIGIGLNSGTMNVGNMGSEFRRAYTVLGDNVNLASRIEGLTKFYGVGLLVSDMTRQGLEDDFVFRFIDKVRVKGKSLPVDLYQPLAFSSGAGETLLGELQLHEQAVAAYFARDWDQATQLFKELKLVNPQVAVYEIYLARIEELAGHCPTEWDGIYTHLEK